MRLGIFTVALSALVLPASAFQIPQSNIKARHFGHFSSSDLGAHEKQRDTTQPSVQKRTSHALVTGVLLGLTTFFGLPPATLADDAMMDTTTPVSQTTANVRAGLSARRYWNVMASTEEGADDLRIQANEGLLDYAVGTVNTMYYDNTGGAQFNQRDFYNRWKTLRNEAREAATSDNKYSTTTPSLATRQGTVQNLKWIISTLNDPYSKYLTREELWQELNVRNDGFLGIGALVEPPEQGDQFFARGSSPTLATVLPDETTTTIKGTTATTTTTSSTTKRDSGPVFQNAAMVQNLPVVTAVVPDSPAERAGITVGDRIVAVGEYTFLGQSRDDVSRNFQSRFATAANYFGHSELTVAKPVFRTLLATQTNAESVEMSSSSSSGGATALKSDEESQSIRGREREVVIGYRQTRVRLPTKSLEEEQFSPVKTPSSFDAQQYETYVASTSFSNLDGHGNIEPVSPPTKGGNAIVHWELLSEGGQSSIFQRSMTNTGEAAKPMKVGYIRLTRFSRASTAGYIEAVQALEDAGATSFIIDVRNNYGGIIQEAMLTASTLLRDPHAVLCYTMNARGGFTPHDVEEYVVDKRYPGYLLSKEEKWVTLNQAQRENPDMFDDNGSRWVPPSSYASLREQTAKRGLHRPSTAAAYASTTNDMESSMTSSWLQWNTEAANSNHNQQWLAQRNLVVLINEGTASAAEVFASSLHDNGRTLALIGSKSYGKGLIQHTFPMPDGGGLRLTVAEYLTPALRHVTVVGGAKFDRVTGEQVGGGIKPDLQCGSKQGIPSNVGADLCVGMALDVLQEAEPSSYASQGQEKHHRQQKMKQRQEQDELMKSGILALGETKGNDSERRVLTSASSSSIVAQEPQVTADARTQDDF